MPRYTLVLWFISAWDQGSLQQYIPSSSKCWMPGDSGRDLLRGESWPPLIGDEKVTAWITFLGWCFMCPLRNYEEWQPMWLDKSITWKGRVKSIFRCTVNVEPTAREIPSCLSLWCMVVFWLWQKRAHSYLRECVNKMEMLYHHGERIPKSILARCSCAKNTWPELMKKHHVFDFKQQPNQKMLSWWIGIIKDHVK